MRFSIGESEARMTTSTIDRARLEELLGEYWEIAFEESSGVVAIGNKANRVLHEIRALFYALAAPATAPEHLEWPEFEPWAQYVGMNVSKDANGYYTSEATDMAWQAWEMAKNQKMTVGPPATAPEQPSWHDAPTVPGLWWVAGTAGIFHIDEAALPIYKGSAHRWFGPIPPDSGDKP